MTNSTYRAVAGWILAAGLLVGCGGDDQPQPPEGTVAENPGENEIPPPNEDGKIEPPKIVPQPPPEKTKQPPLVVPDLPKTPEPPPLPEEWKLAHSLEADFPVTEVLFSPQGKQLVACGGKSILHRWDTAAWQRKDIDTGKEGSITLAVFAPDGTCLVYVVNRLTEAMAEAVVRPLDGEKQQTIVTKNGSTLTALAFAPQGNLLATGDSSHLVELWNVDDPEKPVTLRGHKGFVTALAFSSDGSRLASGSGDLKIVIWDVRRRVPLKVLAGHTKWITDVAFSPDGSLLASVSEDLTCRLWDVSTGKELRQFRGGSQVLTSVAFSPDGRLLATAAGDGRARVFESESAEILTVLTQHSDYVNSVTFSPDGKLLATGGQDKKVLLWQVPAGEASATAE